MRMRRRKRRRPPTHTHTPSHQRACPPTNKTKKATKRLKRELKGTQAALSTRPNFFEAVLWVGHRAQPQEEEEEEEEEAAHPLRPATEGLRPHQQD